MSKKAIDFDDELLDIVRSYPILCTSQHSRTFKNIISRDQCWVEIGKKLGRSPQECKLKFRNIRDTYRRHQQKKKQGTASTHSKYDDERLRFIGEGIEECPPASPSYSTPENLVATPSVSPITVAPMFILEQYASVDDKLSEDTERVHKATHNNTKDSVYNFFNSMADIVCLFPPENIAEMRLKVCKLVTDTELEILDVDRKTILKDVEVKVESES